MTVPEKSYKPKGPGPGRWFPLPGPLPCPGVHHFGQKKRICEISQNPAGKSGDRPVRSLRRRPAVKIPDKTTEKSYFSTEKLGILTSRAGRRGADSRKVHKDLTNPSKPVESGRTFLYNRDVSAVPHHLTVRGSGAGSPTRVRRGGGQKQPLFASGAFPFFI